MSDLDDLRAKAEAATPGPWVGGTVCTYTDEDGKRRGAGSVRREGGAIVFLAAQGPEILTADAEFIAAANPAVILGLLDRLERAEKTIAAGKRIWQSGSHASMEAGLNVYLTLAGYEKERHT